MAENVLVVDKLWKKYSRDLKSSLRHATKQILFGEKNTNALDDDEFWALRDISFELKKGECLGIIGHNGAGKSTLLKCIANNIKADQGSVEVNGELGHIIELTAGFIPTLTGRENTAMRGRLIGKKGKTLEEYIAAVEQFAEIGEFMDSPVQFYSSGMKSRLGFAVTSSINPDVLIIDEVLSVGDLGFRLRCYERINELAAKSGVILVTHSLGQVARLCTKAIYLQKGRIKHYGNVQGAIQLYQEHANMSTKDLNRHVLNPELISYDVHANNRFLNKNDLEVPYGSEFKLNIDVSKIPADAIIRVMLRDSTQAVLMDWNSQRSPLQRDISDQNLSCDIGKMELCPGRYSISLQVMSADGAEHLCLSNQVAFKMTGDYYNAVLIQKNADWSIQEAAITTPNTENRKIAE